MATDRNGEHKRHWMELPDATLDRRVREFWLTLLAVLGLAIPFLLAFDNAAAGAGLWLVTSAAILVVAGFRLYRLG